MIIFPHRNAEILINSIILIRRIRKIAIELEKCPPRAHIVAINTAYADF